ncbi:MAG: asparagine synthase-related protein, partial [Nitrosotalea sp.]
MQDICSRLKSLVFDAVMRCKAESISLSGGLDSSILASCLDVKTTQAYVMVTADFPSTDLVNAQLVAKMNSLKLTVISASIDELLQAIEQTIKILHVFNPIEIRNNIVLYLTMKNAKHDGFKSIMTGDGADELFAGYRFFQRMSQPELQKDLERIWKIMHFPSISISKDLGISLQAPFLDKKIMEYAKSIQSELKVHEENGKKHGKW